MQMEQVLLFKQFESDTVLPGRTIFNIDFVDPTVRPDAPEKQSVECRASLYFLDFHPNTCPALPSDTVAKEVASHVERGLWDDVYSEVLVGRMFVNLGMKFAEMACKDPATTAAVVDMTVLRTPRREWKIRGNSLRFGAIERRCWRLPQGLAPDVLGTTMCPIQACRISINTSILASLNGAGESVRVDARQGWCHCRTPCRR